MRNIVLIQVILVLCFMLVSCGKHEEEPNRNVLESLKIEPSQVDKITLLLVDEEKVIAREDIELALEYMQDMDPMMGLALSLTSNMTFHLKNGRTITIEMDSTPPYRDQPAEIIIRENQDSIYDYSSRKLYTILQKYLPPKPKRVHKNSGPRNRTVDELYAGPILSSYFSVKKEKVLEKLEIEPSHVAKITLLLEEEEKVLDDKDVELVIDSMQDMGVVIMRPDSTSSMTFHLKDGRTRTIDMNWDYPYKGSPGEIIIRVHEDTAYQRSSTKLYAILEKYLPARP